MNVIFISPHFPSHFYNFCARLKERGVNVIGIGDCAWENVSENCKNALCDYKAVSSLKNYDEVYRAVAAYIAQYGRIDFVESENEYWLELDARIRTDFNITSGPKLEDMADMNHKSLMKKAYARAGVPTAKGTLPQSLEDAAKFADEIGYPVIVKPDQGVGATSTYKLHDYAELENFWNTKDNSVTFIEEECVPGHVETFDGITDSHKNVLFCSSQCLSASLMDVVNLGTDVISYTQAPGDDLRDAGERVLKEFDTRNKFFHFEFFRLDEDKEGLGKKGDIVGLEVNMRAPGGRIPDKMNFAYNTDVYTIWADSLIHDKCFMNSEFVRYISHIGRRYSNSYAHSREEIRETWGHCIMEEMEVDPALANEMGDYAYLLEASSLEEMNAQANYIFERA